jgi:hypothetical protein
MWFGGMFLLWNARWIELGKGKSANERQRQTRDGKKDFVPSSASGAGEPAPRGSGAWTLQDDWLCGTGERGLPHTHGMPDTGFVTVGLRIQNVTTTDSKFLAKTARANRITIGLGGLSLGLWCETGMPVSLDPEHTAFILPDGADRVCDIEVEVCWAHNLEQPSSTPSFVSGGLWTAFAEKTGTKFYFSSPTLGPAPYKAAWFDESFDRGHLVLNRSSFPQDRPIFPLEYPIDELVMMHRLSLGEGVEVHALGLADRDGSGYLFLGHSGAGKSTTARLWQAQPGVQLLSDDRIIIRKIDDRYHMYGTPWHGDAGVATAGSAPLTAIFLLEQAPHNQLLPLPQTQAAAELFARCFVPYYREAGLKFTLSFFDELSRSIPCSTFRFAPTENAVEAIRHVCA